MRITKQNKNVWLFIGFLLLGGIANSLSKTAVPALDAMMTCINYVVLIGLLLFWIQSVRIRLLPSGAKSCIISAALLMVLYMLVRIFKYRFAVEVAALRYAVYAYWIPQMIIPALFLMGCIRIRKGEKRGRGLNESLLLVPAVFFALAVMTNDLHSLVYVPHIDISQFVLDTGTYTYGPLFYVLYVWMAVTTIPGLLIVFRESGRLPKRTVLLLLCVVVLWFGNILLNLFVLDRTPYGIHVFNIPETHIFGMLGFFEICIRSRLIPYNENYSGFFRILHVPVVITDRRYNTAYSTEAPLCADEKELRASLSVPVAMAEDLMLYGREIHSGYAFWAEDEGEIHRAQERLVDANETIEQENDLIRAETEQKEKDSYLQSRHRIYHEIAAELYPCQQRIGDILDRAVPGSEDFRKRITEVCVLNAYVKRKTNLLLLAAENESLSTRELFLALQESANYLSLAGLQTTASEPEDRLYPAGRVIALYDVFEYIAEQLLENAPSLMISQIRDGLRLAAKTDVVPVTEGTDLPVDLRKSDDVLYIDIFAGKDGDAA